MKPKIRAADLFCGAGGTSTGLVLAAKELGIDIDLLAINHWNVAIATHSANHPTARHLCESLDNVDPRKAVPGGRLHLLAASPECTHHSNARGGKPMSDQSRASAWHILRWAEALYIDHILVENVREFESWGPLGVNGRPLKSRRGETFFAFLNALNSLGYKVEWRILNAADYGDATTRERLFIQARRGNRRPTWPEGTHSRDGEITLFGQKQKWRAARDIIDWSIPSESIFHRRKPLAESTLRRIEAGLRKFGGKAAEPFIVVLRNHGDARSVDEPLPTITAGGQHVGVCEPFLIGAGGPIGTARPRSVDRPLKTVLTESHIGLVEPFMIPQPRGEAPHNGNDERPAAEPEGAVGLCQPFLVPYRGERTRQEPRAHSIDDPAPTVTTVNGHAPIEPYIVPLNHGEEDSRAYPVHRPMPTLTSLDAWALVEPCLVKYYGTADARPIGEPLDTVTSRDRFGLVIPEKKGYGLNIRFRMLQPHELAGAMSFPDGYQFAGSRELKVKQIGNAVAVRLAQALFREILCDQLGRRTRSAA